MREDAAAALRALVETVDRLRAPGGCPWDREQTHRSLRPYLLEEAYEVLHAIDAGAAPAELREELGDLLLQVLMHAAISAEQPDGFDIGEVAEAARAKMVHRHPHVFGDVAVGGAAEVVVNWERLKAVEKTRRLSILDGVPGTLPALAQALAVQKRPARLGFDLAPSSDAAVEEVRHALDELSTAAGGAAAPRGADWTVEPAPDDGPGAAGEPAPEGPEAAVGELLFAAVSLARRLRVNPEDALRRRSAGFARRFRALEGAARDDGVDLHGVDEAEWRARWAATERR